MQFYRQALFYKLSLLSIWHVKMWKNYAKHVKDFKKKRGGISSEPVRGV